mgnify:CR=1 FL=1
MTSDPIYSDWNPDSAPVIDPSVKFGVNCRFHPFVTIGAVPFSFRKGIPRVRKPVLAGVLIGDDVEILSHTNIDRGTERDTTIGDGTRIDRLVHVAHDAQIGKYCILVAGTIVGGFVVLEDEVYIGMNVSIKPRVRIGKGALIGAGSVVLGDIPACEVWAGNPARYLRCNHDTTGLGNSCCSCGAS